VTDLYKKLTNRILRNSGNGRIEMKFVQSFKHALVYVVGIIIETLLIRYLYPRISNTFLKITYFILISFILILVSIIITKISDIMSFNREIMTAFKNQIPASFLNSSQYIIKNRRFIEGVQTKNIQILNIESFEKQNRYEYGKKIINLENRAIVLDDKNSVVKNGPLVIVGIGGSGKTTWLINKSSELLENYEEYFRPNRRLFFFIRLLAEYFKNRFFFKNSKKHYLPVYINCRYSPNIKMNDLIEKVFSRTSYAKFSKNIIKNRKFNLGYFYLFDDFLLNIENISKLKQLLWNKKSNTPVILTTRVEIARNNIIEDELKKMNSKVFQLDILTHTDVLEILMKYDITPFSGETKEQIPRKVSYDLTKSVEITVLTKYDVDPRIQKWSVDLLKHPLYLYFYIKIKQTKKDFEITLNNLHDYYLRNYKDRLDEKLNYPQISYNNFIKWLCFCYLDFSEKIETEKPSEFQRYMNQMKEDKFIFDENVTFFWHSDITAYILYNIVINDYHQAKTKTDKFSKVNSINFLIYHLTKNAKNFLLCFNSLLELMYCGENHHVLLNQLLDYIAEKDFTSKLREINISNAVLAEYIKLFAHTVSTKYSDFEFADRVYKLSEKIIQGQISINLLELMLMNKVNEQKIEEIPAYAKKLLEVEPTNPKALNSLGLTEMLKGNFANASNYFEMGLKNNPECDDLAINTAISYYYTNNKEKAQDALNILDEYYPKEELKKLTLKDKNQILALKAALYGLFGEYKKGIEIIETQLEQTERNCKTINVMALFYVILGNYNKALPLLEKLYYKLEYKTPAVLFELGKYYLNNNNLPKFNEILSEFERLHPKDFELYILKAMKSEVDSQNLEAINYFHKSLESKESRVAFEQLSRLLISLGQYQEAMKIIEDGLKSFPENQNLKELKSFIEIQSKIIDSLPTKELEEEWDSKRIEELWDSVVSLNFENQILLTKLINSLPSLESSFRKLERNEISLNEIVENMVQNEFYNFTFSDFKSFREIRWIVSLYKSLGMMFQKTGLSFFDERDFEENLVEIESMFQKKKSPDLIFKTIVTSIFFFSKRDDFYISLIEKLSVLFNSEEKKHIKKQIDNWSNLLREKREINEQDAN